MINSWKFILLFRCDRGHGCLLLQQMALRGPEKLLTESWPYYHHIHYQQESFDIVSNTCISFCFWNSLPPSSSSPSTFQIANMAGHPFEKKGLWQVKLKDVFKKIKQKLTESNYFYQFFIELKYLECFFLNWIIGQKNIFHPVIGYFNSESH